MKQPIIEKIALLLTPPLLIGAVIVERLTAVPIPITSHATLQLLAQGMGCGLILGLFAASMSFLGGLKGRVLVAIPLGLAITMALEMAFGGMTLVEYVTGVPAADFSPEPWTPLSYLLNALVPVVVLLSFLGRRPRIILGVAVIAVSATTAMKQIPIGGSAPDELAAAPDKPATIFIVLDEMMGLAGFHENERPEAQAVAGIIENVLAKHGFRVFPNAYSRHYFSAVSIPAMLDFDPEFEGPTPIGAGKTYRLFEQASAAGMPVDVYQTPHINYCTSDAVTRCDVFQSFDPYNVYSEDNLTDQVMMAAVLENLRGSIVFSSLRDRYGPAGKVPLPERFELHGFRNWMQHIGDQITAGGRGRASFLHILAPHAPYLLTDTCGIKDKWTWAYYLTEMQELTGDAFEQKRTQAYQEYFAQTVCVINTLDDMLDRLSSDPAFADATVVVSGDHGSRISAGKFPGLLQRRDYVDNFSTMFAVKAPQVQAGSEPRFTSVQALAAHYLGGLDMPMDGQRTLSLEKPDETWATVPMPVLGGPPVD